MLRHAVPLASFFGPQPESSAMDGAAEEELLLLDSAYDVALLAVSVFDESDDEDSSESNEFSR